LLFDSHLSWLLDWDDRGPKELTKKSHKPSAKPGNAVFKGAYDGKRTIDSDGSEQA
jgi:hypothetical protein